MFPARYGNPRQDELSQRGPLPIRCGGGKIFPEDASGPVHQFLYAKKKGSLLMPESIGIFFRSFPGHGQEPFCAV